ncbi:MAG: hypothetical protein JXQ83_13500 [Candidatus Glassbacteria bacterium]|nr:hypothetical protein [Candidatus Glassbacteria bacterium]
MNRVELRALVPFLLLLLVSSAPAADTEWKSTRVFTVAEADSMARERQPVTVSTSCAATSEKALEHGVFLFEGVPAAGKEVACQVHDVRQQDSGTAFKVTFLCSLAAGESKTYTLAWDGKKKRSPARAGDEGWVSGSGLQLALENEFYCLTTSAETGGAVQDLVNKLGSGKLLQAHLGPLDWSPSVAAPRHPDSTRGIFWMGAHYCRWFTPPEYKVQAGPVFIQIERSGYLPVQFEKEEEEHQVPHLDQKLHVTLTYRFYRDLPFFISERLLAVDEDFPLLLLRHNQWVFRKGLFTHAFFKNRSPDIDRRLDDDEIGFMTFEVDERIIPDHHSLGAVVPENIPWLAFANIHDGDGFADIRLEFRAWNALDPGLPPVFYHPRTYLPNHQGVNYWFKSISYVYTYRGENGPGFTVVIPAGSRYYERQANLVFRYQHPEDTNVRRHDPWDSSWVGKLALHANLYHEGRKAIFPVEKYHWLLTHPLRVTLPGDQAAHRADD